GYREWMQAQSPPTIVGGLSPTLPRILLIVDEFQEFFTEDDKLAQEAALLLDRLVRQGRAFGLHVLLGSQTLGGAYSLARSTIDQMAVRIALQCSEADAQLILSKDNTAARLRPTTGRPITVLDGTPDDSEFADHLRRAADAIGLDGAVVERAELPAAVAELAAELDRRQSGESADRSPRFLLVHGLHRL